MVVVRFCMSKYHIAADQMSPDNLSTAEHIGVQFDKEAQFSNYFHFQNVKLKLIVEHLTGFTSLSHGHYSSKHSDCHLPGHAHRLFLKGAKEEQRFGDFRDDLQRDGYAVIKSAVPRKRADQYAESDLRVS